MKKASEYQRHATECRKLAAISSGEHRDQLLAMASTWDALAEERSAFIRRHPELGIDDDGEDTTWAKATAAS